MGNILRWTGAYGPDPQYFAEHENWYDEVALQVPVDAPEDGDRLRFLHGGLSIPDDGFNSQGTFDVDICDHDDCPWDGPYLSEFIGYDLDGVGTVTIGDATHHGDYVVIDWPADAVAYGRASSGGGSSTMSMLVKSGGIGELGNYTTVDDYGLFDVESGGVGVAGLSTSFYDVTVRAGGTFKPSGINTNVIARGTFTLAGGTLTADGKTGFLLDCANPILLTADSTIDLGNGGLTRIYGGVDPNGHILTWANQSSTTPLEMHYDVPATVNLGGSGLVGIDVYVEEAVTLGEDIACHRFYAYGVIARTTFNGKTITVGNGGIFLGGYGIGRGKVVVPAEITAPAFYIGPGTSTPGTKDGVEVTINGTVTQNGQSDIVKLSGSGTLNMDDHWFTFANNGQTLQDDFFDFTGTITSDNTGRKVLLNIRTASLRNVKKITLPCFLNLLLATGAPASTLYATGGLSVQGGMHIYTFDQSMTLDMDGGSLTVVGASEISYSGYASKIILRAGKHSLGAVSMAAGAAATSGITYGGTVTLTDDHTLSGLVTTLTNASLVIASGKTLKGASARTPTSAGAHAHGGAVTNLALTAANPLYRFGDTSGDSGNGVGVIKCPAPASPSCMPMAA